MDVHKILLHRTSKIMEPLFTTADGHDSYSLCPQHRIHFIAGFSECHRCQPEIVFSSEFLFENTLPRPITASILVCVCRGLRAGAARGAALDLLLYIKVDGCGYYF